MKEEMMKELVKKAYKGYIEMSDEENRIIIDLNTFDEEVKDYLVDKNIDNEDYYYADDEEFLELTAKLNEMLIEEFRKNGYVVYTHGNFYAYDGKFVDVMSDTAVAVKEI